MDSVVPPLQRIGAAKKVVGSREHNLLRKAQASLSHLASDSGSPKKVYTEKIQPALSCLSSLAITSRLGVSRCSASRIRTGKRSPHARHWQALAQLVGVSANTLS